LALDTFPEQKKLTQRILGLLNRKDKSKIILLTFFQLLLGVLDLLGVAMVGLIATKLASRSDPDDKNESLLPSFLTDAIGSTNLFALGVLAVSMFMIKSILAILFNFKLLNTLAKIQSRIAHSIFKDVSSSSLQRIKAQSSSELVFTFNYGMNALVSNSVSQYISLVCEIALILSMFLLLLFISPALSLGAFIYLLFFAATLNSIISPRIRALSRERQQLSLSNQVNTQAFLMLFREIRVLGRSDSFESDFSKLQTQIAFKGGRNLWLQQLPKYLMELSLVLGLFALLAFGATLFSSQDYISVVSMYLAASARLFPSILRIQASLLSLRASSADAELSIEIMDKFQSAASLKNPKPTTETKKHSTGDDATIQLKNLSFKYEDSDASVINDLNLTIQFGSFLVISGKSGSGKSTLCDLLLGLLTPTTGSVLIGGTDAKIWINSNPGLVAYVPQETKLIQGTILENICLGIPNAKIDWLRVSALMNECQLNEFVDKLPMGLLTQVSEGGSTLSGGQRQRIGIARALYSDPAILVLDESTNALDPETEKRFLEQLDKLSEKRTIIVISHGVMNYSPRVEALEMLNGNLSRV
jgi:ABC-type multidrug transport system fused ATPase/permease subunit